MINMQPSNFRTFDLGLIGYPLDHSLSPQIHAAALKACGLQGGYSLFPVRPDDLNGLRKMLDRVCAGEICGLNVTIPHKQNVIPFLDELTPAARVIGAVNTIYLRDDKLMGDNTDAPGFLSDLKKFIANSNLEAGKSALVLGAGGSARAVVYTLINEGWKITIAARRIEQAQDLAKQFKSAGTMEFDFPAFRPSNFPLIINTTPLGMAPNADQSPWPEGLPFPPRSAVYDLVYNPRRTKLVKDAWAAGSSAATGLGMLIEQAALSFETWTGFNPPRKALLDSIDH